MQCGMSYVGINVHSLGIAAHLSLGLPDGSSHLGIRGLTPQIFQFDDVRVLHILEYIVSRTVEDVCIAALVVKL